MKKGKTKFMRLEERIVLDGAGLGQLLAHDLHLADPLDGLWPVVGQSYDNDGTNEFEFIIGADNVDQLQKEATALILGDPSQAQFSAVMGQPAYSDGLIYFGTYGGEVIAVDAQNIDLFRPLDASKGEWRVNIAEPIDPNNPFSGDRFSTTPVITKKHVYISDDNVYSLNRDTGEVEWSVELDDIIFGADKNQARLDPTRAVMDGTSDMVVVKDKLIFGVSSSQNLRDVDPNATEDYTARGALVALNRFTGATEWIWYTTDDQLDPNHVLGAGPGIWASPAVDTQRHLIFIGVGQSYEPDVGSTESTNPYSDSLVAVDYRTGELVWSKQFFSGDHWSPIQYPNDPFNPGVNPDWDVNTHANLFSATIDGESVDLVGVGDKQGNYYILERDQGDPNNVEILATLELDPASTFGGFQGTPVVNDGILYVMTHAFDFGDGNRVSLDIATEIIGDPFATFFGASSKIEAIHIDTLLNDGLAAAKVWSDPTFIQAASSGPLTMANGVLYQTSWLGTVNAIDPTTGDVIWSDVVQPLGPGFNNPLSGGVTIANGRLFVGFGLEDGDGQNPFLIGVGGVQSYKIPCQTGSCEALDDFLNNRSKQANILFAVQNYFDHDDDD